MMELVLCKELTSTLSNYRQAIMRTTDQEAGDDYSRLAAVTQQVISVLHRFSICSADFSSRLSILTL